MRIPRFSARKWFDNLVKNESEVTFSLFKCKILLLGNFVIAGHAIDMFRQGGRQFPSSPASGASSLSLGGTSNAYIVFEPSPRRLTS